MDQRVVFRGGHQQVKQLCHGFGILSVSEDRVFKTIFSKKIRVLQQNIIGNKPEADDFRILGGFKAMSAKGHDQADISILKSIFFFPLSRPAQSREIPEIPRPLCEDEE